MAGLIFWDVDTQHDFMMPDGKLYVPGAEEIIGNLEVLRGLARRYGIRTIASADDHVMEHAEISEHPDFTDTFPPHCMRGTLGQRRIAATELDDPIVIDPKPVDSQKRQRAVHDSDRDILFLKHRFDVFTNPNVAPLLDDIDPDEIVLFGVALDVCDRYAVEGILARRPSTKLVLVTDAVRALNAEVGEALLDDWRGRGVVMMTTEQVEGELARVMTASGPA